MKIHNILKLLVIISFYLSGSNAWADHRQGHVDVKLGELSERAIFGQQIFNNTCAKCHGENGSGTHEGPPLIHQIYNPGHHSNQSIINAITKGVRQHHWPYGNMPAQKTIGFAQAMAVVEFLREVQEQNGIVYQAHRM